MAIAQSATTSIRSVAQRVVRAAMTAVALKETNVKGRRAAGAKPTIPHVRSRTQTAYAADLEPTVALAS